MRKTQALAARYRLSVRTATLTGRIGARFGRATGSSLEFMDFRDYAPGDDLRHVDWRAYARTDQLKVRLYREEVSPLVEILADSSRSMAVTDAKARAQRDLMSAFAVFAAKASGIPRLLSLGGDVIDDADAVPLDRGDLTLDLPVVPLRPRSVRVILSDFLVPGDPGPVIRRASEGASYLYVIQVLDPWELEPRLEGAALLIDCEDGSRLDVDLSDSAVARYRDRLMNLRAAVERATLSAGGIYALVSASEPEVMFRDALLPAAVIEPA
jgi:uncharacterized protein (DUF58 family)